MNLDNKNKKLQFNLWGKENMAEKVHINKLDIAKQSYPKPLQ
jgi:hypothetical protein